MPIPDYQTLMRPLLQCLADGAPNVGACLPKLAQEFHLTEEEVQQLLPSGKQTMLSHRAHWARLHLAKAGLITSPRRNVHEVTPRGREVLARYPDRIDNAVLSQFEEFRAWRERNPGSGTQSPQARPTEPATQAEESQTPEERMAEAAQELEEALADARAYVNGIEKRVVLIDGAELARLLIRHEVGVRPRARYVIRSLDEDYFSDE